MMTMSRMDPAMMQKLMALLGLAPPAGGPGGPMMMPPQVGPQGVHVDQGGFPVGDADDEGMPPSLKMAGERRKKIREAGGGGKKGPPKKGGRR